MARATARKIAGKTAAAARRVTSGVGRRSSGSTTGSTGTAKKSPATKSPATKAPAKKSYGLASAASFTVTCAGWFGIARAARRASRK